MKVRYFYPLAMAAMSIKNFVKNSFAVNDNFADAAELYEFELVMAAEYCQVTDYRYYFNVFQYAVFASIDYYCHSVVIVLSQ